MEEKKEYLSEEQYQETTRKLKKAAKITLIGGLVMLIGGVLLFIVGILVFLLTTFFALNKETVGNAFVGQVMVSSILSFIGGFIVVPGAIISIVGVVLTVVANKREITAFTTQQGLPVAKEGIKKMTPTAGKAAKKITKGVKEGINEADKKDEQN